MPKYLSGRAKRVPQDQLSEDRYRYLGLDQAEPNLSDPLVSPSAPTGAQYQLIAVPGFPGKRYWVPVGGGLVPGAITIFDENSPVSSSSSITQLNFVGAAVTANVSVQSPSGHPGIAATVTVIPVTVGDEPPNTPTPNTGELWWESDTGDLYVYYNDGDSSQWVMANAGGRGLTGDKGDKGQKGEVAQKGQKGEGANVATSSSPPSSPDDGDLWWDTDDGDLHVYYNDGNTSQWVNTSGVGAKGEKGDEGSSGSNNISSMNQATSTGESNNSSTNFQDKVSLSINTASTSRVLLHYSFEIKHSNSNNVYCTGRVNGTNTSLISAPNQSLDITRSESTYERYNGTLFDIGNHSGTRTYKIQFNNSSTGYSYIKNASLVAIEMTI